MLHHDALHQVYWLAEACENLLLPHIALQSITLYCVKSRVEAPKAALGLVL